MKYALENIGESERLEKQASLNNYSISEELQGLVMPDNQRILDAGCGTGVLSRYLIDQFGPLQIDACDISDLRLKQAKDLSRDQKHKSIQYLQSDLGGDVIGSGNYDHIFSRLVFQHLQNPLACAQALYRSAKEGGRITVIDADGIIFDLYSENEFLNDCLSQIKKRFKFNMYIGRALPGILKKAGFKNISWKLTPMVFQNEALKEECEQNKLRFSFIRSSLVEVFQSVEKTDYFIQSYLSEMMKPENVLFYNKFIITAEK